MHYEHCALAYLFTSEGFVNMKNAKYKNDFSPLDEKCDCYTCQKFSKAYLRHLFIAGEVLALELASIHNLSFYINLTDTAREKIIEGNFSEWKNKIISKLSNKINN